MMGIMPGHIYQRGRVGVVTRSGTLGYEAASQMSALGVGISTSVGIGGDPINGSSFVDMLVLFEQDPETDAVMIDRKSTRLNSSHLVISYAVFCLKKKKKKCTYELSTAV